MYNADPEIYDHKLTIGDTYRSGAFTLTEPDGTTAIDITGLTGVCKVFKDEFSGEVVLTPTVSIVDAASGTLEWTSSAATTASLVAGSNYKFACRVTFLGGDTKTIVYGSIAVVKML